MEHTDQEKAMREKNLFFDRATIAMVAEDTMPMEEEPQTFSEAWDHPNPKS